MTAQSSALTEWTARCRDLLTGNQISSRSYRYTRPAPHVYEYQWLWDSCFHAITYRWFDGPMAWDELRSLVQHQVTDGPDAGMIPHMAYWQPDGLALWGVAERSIITQPPLIATAAWRVHQQQPNLAALAALYPQLVAYHEWFDRRRDLDNDHLVTLIHPWESGWDASPRWDAAMGLEQPSADESKAARHALVGTLRAHNCDARTLRNEGSFAVKAVDFNAIRAADCEALGQITEAIGQSGIRWHEKAALIQDAVREKCLRLSDERWIAHDLVGSKEQATSPDSAAKFVLLFGGCASTEQATALVNDLRAVEQFATPFPVPTTPQNSPVFDGDTYWRGNVWLSVNWLIVQGLRRYGEAELTRHIAQRSLELVAQAGFHEYFNPLTGRGHGPAQQSWSAIVLDFVAEGLAG